MTPNKKSIFEVLMPPELIAGWQRRVDLVAKITSVTACLIRQPHGNKLKILAASNSEQNPFQPGDTDKLDSVNFCNVVINKRTPLNIINAYKDQAWRESPDVSKGMIAYMGYPLQWPDGQVFGVLCVMDSKENAFCDTHHELMQEFVRTIEADLEKITVQNTTSDDNKLWRAMQSAALESVLVMDINGTFLSANEIGAERFGMKPSELVGKNLYKIIPPDVAKSRREKLGEVIKSKRSMRFEDIRQGRYFDFTVHPVLNEQSDVEKLVVFAADITERRVTRRALEKSERKYRELVEEASTVILRWDVQGNVTFFNEYAQKFFGFSEEEILGKNVVGTIVPETEFTGRDLVLLMEEIRRDPDKFKDNENENIKRNGERVWIAWKNRPIYDEQGELCEIHSVGIDITARKKAEDALRESEAKWRSLTENSMEHIMMLDEEGKIIFINHTVPDLTIEQVIGMPMVSFLPAAYAEPTRKLFKKVWQTGEPDQYTVEYEGEGVATQYFEANVRAVKDNDKVTALIVSARNITERKQAQEALRASEERLRLLVSQADFILWSINKDLKFTSSVGGGLYELGMEPDQVVNLGLDLYQYFQSDSPEYLPIQAHFEALKGKSITYENEWQGRYFQTQVSPQRDDDGRIVGCVGVAIDITDRKRIEKELEQYKQHLEELVAIRTTELENSNKELESYSYSIAHDLRAPLRSITGFSQILKEDAQDKLSKEDLDTLERIVAAGKNMSELIDDILELSRITRSELHFEQVSLSDIGENIISRLKQSHPERLVQWKVQDDLKVKGDSRLLELALQNLIENAWKYTRDKQPAQIQLASQQQQDETVYYIKDNGVGFDMQYENQLFKPFHRLHSPKEFEGTGIGLATVQRIIQRHGGRIWANTKEGSGATFYFTLREHDLH